MDKPNSVSNKVGKPDNSYPDSFETPVMSIRIYVDAYSGYKANEHPIRFTADDEAFDIASVEDRWQDPNAEYFKVRTVEGKLYLLRYDEQADEWTLQSGF